MKVADKVVQVPEMAESISEGTLKQWSKRSYAGLTHTDGGYALSIYRDWRLCGAR
jgi:hypothetical protein